MFACTHTHRPFNGIQKYIFIVNIDKFEYAQQHTELLATVYKEKWKTSCLLETVLRRTIYEKAKWAQCRCEPTQSKSNEKNILSTMRRWSADIDQMKNRSEEINWTNPRFWVTVDEITNVVGWQRHIVYTRAGSEKINNCSTRNIDGTEFRHYRHLSRTMHFHFVYKSFDSQNTFKIHRKIKWYAISLARTDKQMDVFSAIFEEAKTRFFGRN